MCLAVRALPNLDGTRPKTAEASFHGSSRVIRHRSSRGHDVATDHLIARIGQPRGKLRVGRQQQQPGAGQVEASDGDQGPGVRPEDIEHRSPALRIASRGDDPAGFVEREGAPFRRASDGASDGERTRLGNDELRGIRDDCPATVTWPDRIRRWASRRDARPSLESARSRRTRRGTGSGRINAVTTPRYNTMRTMTRCSLWIPRVASGSSGHRVHREPWPSARPANVSSPASV